MCFLVLFSSFYFLFFLSFMPNTAQKRSLISLKAFFLLSAIFMGAILTSGMLTLINRIISVDKFFDFIHGNRNKNEGDEEHTENARKEVNKKFLHSTLKGICFAFTVKVPR